MHIGLIRMDFIPETRVKDVCLASVRNYLHIPKNSCIIKHPDYTVRFTSSLCLSIFIKKRFAIILSQLGSIVFQLRKILNRFKSTPVKKFKIIRISNIQSTGYLSSGFYTTFNTSRISDECYAGNSNEPPVRFYGSPPKESQYFTVERSVGSHVKFCRNGYFSIISKNINDFLYLVEYIQKQKT